ncbi:MAG: hypothetical protein PWQ96_2089 [Clostridia bacterium]|jgi:hypothetical protein|nr:hypothetical protein [Clostridiales bacterium]MDK2986445.1 hypothetical protein [Clostridia bacterium]
MKSFFVRFPGNFYPDNFYGKDEQDARRQARKWLEVSRLPKGTELWESHREKSEADFDYPSKETMKCYYTYCRRETVH